LSCQAVTACLFGSNDSLFLLLLDAARICKENIEHSFVHIIAPKLLSKGAGRDLGNPGFAGYLLHLSRIMQLVDDAPKDQSIDK
jgi:hypothetical protein